MIEILRDEVEERSKLRVPGPFGCLLGPLIDFREERKDFLWGERVEIPFTELSGQLGKDQLVGLDGVFLNEDCDTPANNGCLERPSWYTSSLDFS